MNLTKKCPNCGKQAILINRILGAAGWEHWRCYEYDCGWDSEQETDSSYLPYQTSLLLNKLNIEESNGQSTRVQV